MNEKNKTPELPSFLNSFEDLTTHFDEHFGSLGSNERGDSFLSLSEKLIPLIEKYNSFPPPIPNEKKSHDGGVDLLSAENLDGQRLCIQSKYKIRDKGAFDSIISKFKNYEDSLKPIQEQPGLWEDEDATQGSHPPLFIITTSSKLSGIVKKYKASTLASKTYYEKLISEKRLDIVDGPKILTILEQLYRKSNLIPANISLESENGWVKINDVHIGVVNGTKLTDLYSKHGDALFFENIRDFLGVTSGKVVTTRSTVNQEIISTISSDPEKMLSRNNGIVFRAIKATLKESNNLNLEKAAIVNGCQTTMSLVHCQPVPNACQVLVKVVVVDDAWDIAKAANYQNEVARIDLDLARYLRPQLVRRIATTLGYAIETSSESNASSVLNTIYQYKVDYDELKLLYLGLFSRKPNNIFDTNYTDLRVDVLENLYKITDSEEKIFSVMLLILKESRRALEICSSVYAGEEYAPLFKRFYKDDKPRYRSLLAVAAACSAVRQDISERNPKPHEETERVQTFLTDCRSVLENSPKKFQTAYKYAFAAIADTLLDIPNSKSEMDIYQGMYNKISTISFSSLYKRTLIRIDSESCEK